MTEMKRELQKVSFKDGLSVIETIVLVQKACKNEAVNRSNVFRWHPRFGEGREPVEDNERGGEPKSTRTEVNIAAVADLFKSDSRFALRMKEEPLNIPRL
jgi:hypothetical protein